MDLYSFFSDYLSGPRAVERQSALLRRLPGVKRVHVDPQDGRIIIDYAPLNRPGGSPVPALEQERSVIRSSTNWLTD
jgi:hypothetical protein